MLTKSNLVLISTTLLEIFILSLMNTATPAWVIMALYAILGLGLRHMIQTQATGIAGIILALIALYLLNL
jgi:heptaprenylglyceryl phosphate synthase